MLIELINSKSKSDVKHSDGLIQGLFANDGKKDLIPLKNNEFFMDNYDHDEKVFCSKDKDDFFPNLTSKSLDKTLKNKNVVLKILGKKSINGISLENSVENLNMPMNVGGKRSSYSQNLLNGFDFLKSNGAFSTNCSDDNSCAENPMKNTHVSFLYDILNYKNPLIDYKLKKIKQESEIAYLFDLPIVIKCQTFKINNLKTENKNEIKITMEPKMLIQAQVQEACEPKWNLGNGGSQNEEYTYEDLENLYECFSAYYLNAPLLKYHFNQLNQNNKILFCLNLKRIFKLDKMPNPLMDFKAFKRNFMTKKTKKRNEEKVKMVYKQLFKILETKFNYECTSFLRNHLQPKYEEFLKTKRSSFYLFLFKETIEREEIAADLVMDILYEKIKSNSLKMNKDNNWARTKKVNAMTKFSKAIRFLIQQDEKARKLVLSFMNCGNNSPIMWEFRKTIGEKLEKKKLQWKNTLKRNNFNFESFRNDLEKKMDGKKYKFPWRMEEIEESISFCKEEQENLDGTDLKVEFDKIQSKHYSEIY